MSGLTNKQRKFIDEYLKTFNATEAARRAKYGNENTNDVTLAAIGSENLRKPKIAEKIAEYFIASTMSKEEVLARLADIARAEYAAYLNPDGTFDLARLLVDGKGYLVKGIRETRYGRQIEFYDSQKALVDIGRHHVLFADRQEITGAGGGPVGIKITEVIVNLPKDDD